MRPLSTHRHARGRFAALAAIVLLFPLATGCEIHAGQVREYRRDGEVYPKKGAPEPPDLKATSRSALIAGIRKWKTFGADRDELHEAGDPRELGETFRDAVSKAKIFKDVVYPLEEQDVDVELEPVVSLVLDKDRGTNFLKILPGIFFPWISGFGFNYDHVVALELRVCDARTEGHPLCDTFKGDSALELKRYPSIFWFAGIHASLIVLVIIETVTTDTAEAKLLADKDAQIVDRAAVEWLIKEFSPGARVCPDHPEFKQSGFHCMVPGCKKVLGYPILNRRNGRTLPPAAPSQAGDTTPAPHDVGEAPTSTTAPK